MDTWDIVRGHYQRDREIVIGWLQEGWEPFAVTAHHDGEVVWLRKKIEQEVTLEEAVSEIRNKPAGKQGRGTGKATDSKK